MEFRITNPYVGSAAVKTTRFRMKRVYIMALLYSIALSANSILSFRKQHQGEEEVEALYFKALRVPEVQDVEEDTSRGMLFASQGTTTIVPVGQIVLVRHKEGKPRKSPPRHCNKNGCSRWICRRTDKKTSSEAPRHCNKNGCSRWICRRTDKKTSSEARTDSKMDEAGARTAFLTRSHEVWEAFLLQLYRRPEVDKILEEFNSPLRFLGVSKEDVKQIKNIPGSFG